MTASVLSKKYPQCLYNNFFLASSDAETVKIGMSLNHVLSSDDYDLDLGC